MIVLTKENAMNKKAIFWLWSQGALLVNSVLYILWFIYYVGTVVATIGATINSWSVVFVICSLAVIGDCIFQGPWFDIKKED